jgi:hypothetical protein
MSKVSSKARYIAFQEWYNWASQRYTSMKRKKKVRPDHLAYGTENDY